MIEHGVRDSGIAAVGNLPWGAHICQFYRTRDDLVETLMPYVVAGLHAHQSCRLIELHGGTTEARSAGFGHGAEFVVRLSLASEPEGGAGHGAGGGDRPESAPARLLVVDDNEDATESLRLLLEMSGHDVRTAADGTTALAVAAEFVPDVVLLDIGLPGMDGCEVARRMRALPATRDAYLVALTGYGHESDRERVRESGFDRHELKPIAPDVLDELIRARRGARR